MAEQTRINRVADRIRDEVSDILFREIKDPRLGFVTVTRVIMSRDLRHARILYSILGADAERRRTAAALESAQGFIRREIGRRVALRFCPEIEFRYDRSIETSIRISELLDELGDDQS